MFSEFKEYIEDGDLVMVFINRKKIKSIKIKAGEKLSTRYGIYEHNEMIGKRYGDQMIDEKKGFIFLLSPTVELWSNSLKFRTQIVYLPDASYIVQRLELNERLRVIEAGTGSGAFTHHISRCLGSRGVIFTYEWNLKRYNEAKKELKEHGISKNIIISHQNVCTKGFDVDFASDEFLLNGGINADLIFLDLPSPWSAIPFLTKVICFFKKVSLCSFSPCVEQVKKTIQALTENGWTNIETVEISTRNWEVRNYMIRNVNDSIKRLKSIKAHHQRKYESDQPSSPSMKKNKIYNPFGKGTLVKPNDPNFDWKSVTNLPNEIRTHTSFLTFANYLVCS